MVWVVLLHAHATPHLCMQSCMHAGTARSSDFTDPLEELEDPRTTWLTWLAWLPSKFGPFVPPGIRHSGLPTTGAMAYHRVMAILKVLTGSVPRLPASLAAWMAG